MDDARVRVAVSSVKQSTFAVKGAVDQLHRMDRLHACPGQVHRTPGVGTRHKIGRDLIDCVDLSSTDIAGDLGMQNRVGTACATAQAIVVEFDQSMDEGRQHGAGCCVDTLYVPEVARILHSHTDIERADRRKTMQMVGEPFLDVDDSVGERLGLRSAQQMSVLLHRSTAAGRVDHDRALVAVDGQRGDRRLSPAAGIRAEPGMGVQGTAAGCDVARRGDAEPGGLHHSLTGMMDVALPGIHDAAGEQIDIVATGDMSRSPQRQITGESEAPGSESQTDCDSEQGATETKQAGVGQHTEGEPLWASRELPSPGECFTGRLDETAVGHATRARRFATATLHTCVECVAYLTRDWSPVVLDLTHQPDPPPWGQRFVARHPVGRAVGEAEPTLHTRIQVLGIDPQVHVERPGLSRPVGSKSCFIRSAIWAATGSGLRTGWAVVAQTVPTPMLATNSPSTNRSA